MMSFKDFTQYAWATRVISGRDVISSTGFEFAKEGAERVLVVTDQVIRGTGLVDRACRGIESGGLEVADVFDAVPQDSSTQTVEDCAQMAAGVEANAFLAVGGGSVMDTSKLAAVLHAHGGTVHDYEGVYTLPRARTANGEGAPLPLTPLACIPTTAGSGSEVSMGAVIKDHAARLKLEFVDYPLFPSLAIIDPESTRSLPPHVAAATGLDALTHAIEGYVSVDSNPFGDAKALHAVRLIAENLERAVHEGDDGARGNMQVAAALAITTSLGIAHSLSHACGAQLGIPHGVANAINLPHSIRFNAAAPGDTVARYRDIAAVMGVEERLLDVEVGEALADRVVGLARSVGLPTRLSAVGVSATATPELAAAALLDACTLMNPRQPTASDLEQLLDRAL